MRLLTKTMLLLIFTLFSRICIAQIKVKFDVLISNTTLVDVINKRVVEGQFIGVRGGKIVFISSEPPQEKAIRTIDGKNLIALPGFIDTHTHLWQHICKSCFPNESLQKWVGIYRVVHYLEPDEIRKIVLAASGEALLSGITSVSDYASLSFNDYGFWENAKAIRDAGLGGIVVWHNPSIFLPDRIKLQEIQRYQRLLENKLSIWMGPGPLSFHPLPQVYSGIWIGQKLGLHFTEHTMENNQEQKDFYDSLRTYLNTYGNRLREGDRAFLSNLVTNALRPSDNDAFSFVAERAKDILANDEELVRSLNKNYKPLTLDEKQLLETLKTKRIISPVEILNYLHVLPQFLSIHSVWQQPEDIQLMKLNDVSISHNPESNLYLSSGLAPIQDYLKSFVPISIGTDGAASNDAIDFFSAMKAMWNVAKIKAMNPEISRQIDEWTVIQAATIGGARALLIDSLTGSLNLGKEADITLVAKNELGMSPIRSNNLVAVLIYSGSSRNVKYVLSDGIIRVDNGKLTDVSENTLANDLTRIAITADKRRDNGKTWREKDTLKAKDLSYWYRYRSVRAADDLDITILNQTGRKLAFTIASSSTTFGGGTANIVDTSVSNRFPDTLADKAFEEEITLQIGESVSICKAKGTRPFILSFHDQTKSYPFKSGQLMLLCEGKEK